MAFKSAVASHVSTTFSNTSVSAVNAVDNVLRFAPKKESRVGAGAACGASIVVRLLSVLDATARATIVMSLVNVKRL